MKLIVGLAAALSGLAAAAQQAAEVYILPAPPVDIIEPAPSQSVPSIPRGMAGLIFLQRLAAAGKGPSSKDLPEGYDIDLGVAMMNMYGKTPAPLFHYGASVAPSQLLVMVEGMSDDQFRQVQHAVSIKPAFTIPDPPSASAHDKLIKNDFYNVGVTKEHQCPMDQVINPFEEACWSDKSTVAKYNVQKNPDLLNRVLDNFNKMTRLAAAGEMETTLVFLPVTAESFSTNHWSNESQELRRRQGEEVIASDNAVASSVSTSSLATMPSAPARTILAACFSSMDSCVTATSNCSSHGVCHNKYANRDGSDGREVCYTCRCLSTASDQGSVTHWAGGSCAKQDVSTPFWLFFGFTVALVGILYLAIGMLFSVGEEKLPGVIGAGVSKAK